MDGFWVCCLVLLTLAEGATLSELARSDLQNFIVPQKADAKVKRQAAFDFLWRRYYSRWWNMTGSALLSMPGLKPHEVTIQYEFEVVPYLYKMNTTPELLLLHAGIEDPDLHAEDSNEVFRIDSPWWKIEVEGTGTRHSQRLRAMPECNSAVVRPEAVLNGSVTDALLEYFRKRNVSVNHTYGHFQFTLGLPLELAGDVLNHTRYFKKRVSQTAEFCKSRKPRACSPKYEGLLLLCQMVLDQAADANACGFPKRFQKRWLLRTHVGDLAMTVPEDERHRLAEDVLGLRGDQQLYPKGIMDELEFPEMAELGGIVKKRVGRSGKAKLEMPTDLDGLKKVAAKMLKHRAVSKRIKGRPCTLNAPGNKNWTAPTAREWLEGAQQGLDLMSDHDSPLSQASLSKTVWQSMGSWRWSKDEPRIFLECRDARKCLGKRLKKWKKMSYSEIMKAAAVLADELERVSLDRR